MNSRTTTPDERALAPDLARGATLALIAMANVMIYLHGRPYGLRQHIVEPGIADRVTAAVLTATVDGRAYPLFAALFGYGLVRIADRARERGLTDAEVTSVVRRRSAWLVVFGLVHAALGFSGDVLGWYGLLGSLLASRLGLPNRTLGRLAVVWLVLASAIQGAAYADPSISSQRTFLWSFAIEDPLVAAAWRAPEWLMTPIGLLAVVSAVLAGIWAGRRRLLETPGDHLPTLRVVTIAGIGAGLVGGVGMALAVAHVWSPPFSVLLGLSWLHIMTGVLGGLGYAAGFAWWSDRLSRRARLPRVIVALRAAGERSLSCYLAQSVVFVALLPAWSLGIGAYLTTTQALVLALATWAATVLLAALLAAARRTGPAEELLRRLRAIQRPAAGARATIP